MALKGYAVLVVAENDEGEWVLSYGVAAHDEAEAGRLALGGAMADGYWNAELDDIWRPDDVDDDAVGGEPAVIGRGEPVFADEDDQAGYGFVGDDDDDDDDGDDWSGDLYDDGDENGGER
jgi:hypothetical protein